MKKVAAATVTFNNGEDEVTTKLLKIDNENGNYIVVDLLEVFDNTNFMKFLNKDIKVKVMTMAE